MKKCLRNTLGKGMFTDISPTRSHVMQSIKSKGNKTTEVRLRFALVRARLQGWVMHPLQIFGKPDFYFVQEKLAIFVDGCFWHGCPICGHFPKSNTSFWVAKIEDNRARDAKVLEILSRSSIDVLRFWEHEIVDIKRVLAKINASLERIRMGRSKG